MTAEGLSPALQQLIKDDAFRQLRKPEGFMATLGSEDGACHLLLSMPEGWQAIVPWIEQLMEESLGKGNKGVVVFTEQPLNHQSSASDTSGTLHVQVTTGTASPQQDKEWRYRLLLPPHFPKSCSEPYQHLQDTFRLGISISQSMVNCQQVPSLFLMQICVQSEMKCSAYP